MRSSSVSLLMLVTAALGLTHFRSSGAAEVVAEDAWRMTVDLLASQDDDFRQIALDRLRNGLRGREVTRRVVELLPKLSATRQAELVATLEDRGDPAAVPALTALLSSSPDEAVRVAVLRAVGRLGGGDEVPLLITFLSATDAERAAARRGLVLIDGAAGASILTAARQGDPGLRATLLEVLTERRARTAVPDLVVNVNDESPVVRAAAMRGLATLGGPDEVEAMVRGVLKAAAGAERDDAERALVTVCTLNAGKERAAEKFFTLFEAADESTRESLVPTLGRVGGPQGIAVVDALVASSDENKRRLGLSALTRWPDATVATRLLDLVPKANSEAERDSLLAALIRIAPLPDNKLHDSQKLELLQKTMTLCRRETDRRRIVERANAIRTIDALRFVVPFLDDPTLAEPACQSIVELAHHRGLRDANKDEFTRALDKVITTTKNPELVERAQRYKQGQTWERKKPPAKS